MVENEIVSRISQKIRTVRLKKNLTIQQLADRSSVTKGLLSRIENSRTIPSLPVFVQIIQSLEISFKEFFEDMALGNGRDYILIKKDQQMKAEREGREGFEYRFILSQTISTPTVNIELLRVKPGATGRYTTTDGFEFKYMISGSCEYHINGEVVLVEEGDAIYFDASLPHLPVNRNDREAVMLVVYFVVAS